MSEPIDTILWGVLLRITQTAIEAAPYLLFGAIAAGVLRAMVPRPAFGALSRRPAWQRAAAAAAFVAILPWSSFSVLPAARELRRAGVNRWAVLCFVLVAPAFGFLSIAYLFSVVHAAYAAGLLAACLLIPLAAAWAGRQWGGPADVIDAGAAGAGGAQGQPTAGRRLALALVAASREMGGPVLRDLALGLAGVAVLAVLVPDAVLDHGVARPSPASTPLGIAVAAPAYLSPDQAMMAAGVAYGEGNSYGSTLAFVLLGAGVNLAAVWWAGRSYGWRTAGVVGAAVVLLVLCVGYAADAALPHLRPSGDHHHALSRLGLPDQMGRGREAVGNYRRQVRRALDQQGPATLAGVGILAVLGLGLRLLDRGRRFDARLSARVDRAQPGSTGWWDRPLSARAVGIATTGGVVVLGVVCLYVLFPPPERLLDEMRGAVADVLDAASTGDRQSASERAGRVEELAAKLPLSVAVRTGPPGGPRREGIAEVRRRAQTLRRAADAGNKPDVRAEALATNGAINRCQRVLSGTPVSVAPAPSRLAAR